MRSSTCGCTFTPAGDTHDNIGHDKPFVECDKKEQVLDFDGITIASERVDMSWEIVSFALPSVDVRMCTVLVQPQTGIRRS